VDSRSALERAPPLGDEAITVRAEANRVKPVLGLAVVGLMAAALFGFGQLLGAWDTPASAGPEAATTTTEPTTPPEEQGKESGGAGQGQDDGRAGRTDLPALVLRKLDAVCRRARTDALAIVAQGRPTTKARVRRLFEQLGALNTGYNREALEALGGHADDPRVRTLTRLFRRDERLVDDLLAAIPALESRAGQARFERGLEELRRVGDREERVLAALGARSCDSTFVG
jgi:hypothetical protein